MTDQRIRSQLLEGVSIESATSDGKCVARWNNQVIFVEGVAPGDIADLRIIRKKRHYLEAIPERVVHQSDIRVQPFCDHFGVCGGCKWQHIDYKYQLDLKRQLVVDSLQRIGGLVFPKVEETLASPMTSHHRNKLEFTFTNRRWLTSEEVGSGTVIDRNGVGFHKPRQFDKIVDIEYCHLQEDPSNQIRNSVRKYALEHGLGFFDILKKEGFLRNLVIRNTTSGELMVIVQAGHDDPALTGLLDFLSHKFPEITSLQYVINSKGNETFFDLPVILHSGSEYITDQMGDLKFRIGPKSFYQTNGHQAHEMYKLVRELAGLSGNEIVYDLYTGAGTIALFLASNAKTIVGVEQVPEAIEDARVNAGINGIENTHFYTGDIKEVIANKILGQHGQPDIVITDPPRSGMHRDVVDRLIELAPARMVYVSCNPATQARDLALLAGSYQIRSVHPIDMFPHTAHVESVIMLERN